MEIIEKDRSRLADIKPLWEELNAYHGRLSAYFKEHFRSFTFEKRISALTDKKDLSVFIVSGSISGRHNKVSKISKAINWMLGNKNECVCVVDDNELRGVEIRQQK